MFDFIPPEFYRPIFLVVMGILVVVEFNKCNSLTTDEILYSPPTWGDKRNALILTLLLILFFGFRDPFADVFADTSGYAGYYFAIEREGTSSVRYDMLAQSGEQIWVQILFLCGLNGLGIHTWFTVVAAIYIGGIFFLISKLFPNNVFLGSVFAFLNFGFYSGAVNGIRNADALSMILVALYFITSRHRNILISLLFMVIAYYIHHSALLPAVCLVVSAYAVRKPQWAIGFWLLSIVISLVAGSAVSAIFEGLGFDDRMTSYLEGGSNLGGNSPFSHTGFRWDFLLFSAAPIVWGWYVTCRLKISDAVYPVIFNTYVLANSFWVMVIRAAFSNRFAMLSWFLYFLVIAYPLLKLNISDAQGRWIGFALIFLLLIAIFI